MKNKIAIEGHFAIPETLGCSKVYFDDAVWPQFSKKIQDFMDIRLPEMDEYGIEVKVLSLNSPAIQSIWNRKEAVEVAKKANDVMAEAMAKKPDRFKGFAALPMQDPDAAIKELERCVKEYGCVGALVNGFSQIDSEGNYEYLDHEMYDEFWACVAELDVPFYLHPRETMKENIKTLKGQPWLEGAAWAFGVETATHALRLMGSGMFDKYPNIKIILGHLGEMLPFCIWRSSNRISKTDRGQKFEKPFTYYFENNFYVTTSGQFHTRSLIDTQMELGTDKILFAADFPFEDIKDACTWFDNAPISEHDRYKIGRQNSIDLFKLNLK